MFYDKNRWFAFLAAPPHTKGHAILSASKRDIQCPKGFSENILADFEIALSDVINALNRYYKPKDVLMSSVRGDIQHFHIHLIPLWEKEEKNWREITGYESAHLLEYLGCLEKKNDFIVLQRQARDCISEKSQREEWTENHIKEITCLRSITGYKNKA